MAEEVSPKIIRPEASSPNWFPSENWIVISKIWTSLDLQGAKQILQDKINLNAAKGVKSLWLAECLLEVTYFEGLEFKSEEHKKQLDEKFFTQYEEVDKMIDYMVDEFKPETGISGWFSSPRPKEEQEKRSGLYLSALVASGYASLLRASLHYNSEEPIKGTYYLKKSWEGFQLGEKFIAEHKDKIPFDPAMVGLDYFGVAVFEFAFSMIPPILQKLGNLVGFEANRENAIRLLNHTYLSGCPRAIESGLLLMGIKHFLLDEEEEAKSIFQKICQAYPESFLLSVVSSYMARSTGELDTALDSFQKVLAYHEKKQNIKPIASNNREIAICYWYRNDFKNAIPYFEKFLNVSVEVTKKNFRPMTAFNLGLCYFMEAQMNGETPNTEKIISLYKKAFDWIRDDESYDLLAKRKMEHFIKTKTFTKPEQIHECANALIEGKQWDKAREYIEQIVEFQNSNPENRDYFALYHYVLGRCFGGKKDFENARVSLEKVVAEDGKLKTWTWTVPYALLALGETAMDEKKWNEALTFFDKTKKYENYDWEKLLLVLVYGNKQTLMRYIPNLQL